VIKESLVTLHLKTRSSALYYVFNSKHIDASAAATPLVHIHQQHLTHTHTHKCAALSSQASSSHPLKGLHTKTRRPVH